MYAVIRIRGRTGIRKNIADTLDMLNLTRISHAVVIPDTPSYKGMLQKAKDYITNLYNQYLPYSEKNPIMYEVEIENILLGDRSHIIKTNKGVFETKTILIASGNGNSIVFESVLNNIVDEKYDCSGINGIKNCINIFKYDINNKQLFLISTNNNRYGGNSNSVSPSISDDGRFVSYQSSSNNIVNYSQDDNDLLSLSNISSVYFVDTLTMNTKIISKYVELCQVL